MSNTQADKPLAAHTPGPWTSDAEGEAAVAIEGADGSVVCEVFGACSDPLCEANAALIAAAPDLLKALVAMEAEKSDYMRLNNLGDPAREHTNKMAREAIAKATGAAA